jgi:hypothetical protein
MVQTKDTVEAFGFSMRKNFPQPPEGWSLITQYEGSKILEGYMSPNTFKKYVKRGDFRSVDGKVFKEEVEKYKESADFIALLYDKHILEESREDGEKKIVLFPSSVNKLGLGDHSQKMKAGLYTIKQPWFQDWIKSIDFS